MEENLIKPIEESKPVPTTEELKSNDTTGKDVINQLPDWNIEPPIEIKRGEE